MTNSEYPLTVRFTGPQLQATGVPITDLGQSLIAIQRMVHISYLVGVGRPFVRAHVRKNERQALALHIAGQEKRSDAYLLDWFVREVVPGIPANLISDTIFLLAGAAGAYVTRMIEKKLKSLRLRDAETDLEKIDFLAVRVFNEFQDLANQIGSEGGIDSVEIYFKGHSEPIVIDEKVKNYINSLEGREVPGEPDEYIIGEVDKAHTLTRDCVEIWLEPTHFKRRRRVKVCMDQNLFDRLLYELTDPDRVKYGFTGQARYTIGRSLNWSNVFEATDYQLAQ